IDANIPFHKEDSIREIASRLEKLTAESMKEARALITSSSEDFTKACNYLMKAENIVIFGVGDAYLAGLAFQARMMRAGFNHFLSSPVYGEQRHLAQTLTRNDCGILLSFSGVTESTVDCARILKKNHVPSIALTSIRQGELVDLAGVTLFLPDREKKFRRYANFSSHACMEYYLNVLYSYYFTRKYDDITKVNID
nr:SIS domain-containing protein [Solobacterium sp.]